MFSDCLLYIYSTSDIFLLQARQTYWRNFLTALIWNGDAFPKMLWENTLVVPQQKHLKLEENLVAREKIFTRSLVLAGTPWGHGIDN